jgi:hypothetical protein
MTREIHFNDGMRPGKRVPYLYMFKPGQNVVRFQGVSIPGLCVVTGESYTKQGMWSNTDYIVQIGDETKAFPICNPLHGKAFENVSSLDALMRLNKANYGSNVDFSKFMTVEEFTAFMIEFFPVTWKKFENVQAQVESL